MSAVATRPTISRTDLERKMRELQGGVDHARASATSYAIAAGAVVVVAVVGVAFLMGRRRGKRSRTVVEVRRI